MILEVAFLNLRSGQSKDFEHAFADAQALFHPWTDMFHISCSGASKRLLHHFYDPLSTVEHFEPVLEGSAWRPTPGGAIGEPFQLL